jgi:hypothetical protein
MNHWEKKIQYMQEILDITFQGYGRDHIIISACTAIIAKAYAPPQEGSSPQSPCSFGLISRISSHPAVFFSHNKPANSAFSTINQRNEQAEYLLKK